ncbi:GGDEF family protein [Phenylobacterium zucineum HLK1]|uniref:diguanylate cyclase n=1 Tax=Phenylobacterium zucineum (strain HLK1) TaxID=450851 RepID=B4RBS6_PHEZH|nr:GGDEF domain-containing protein [Phenylobacterium zucineum]ACG78123.1 GGDEF family protein [Phenylobacterium zucineum HLK1]
MSSDVETSLRGPKAYALARKAIEAMEAHQVWPTALNFELWVHYVAAKDSALATEIDHLIEAGEPFTDAVGEQLAAQFLPKAKLNGEILEAGQTLSKELDSVSRAIESARETSEAYGQQLASASESLDGEDAQAIKSMVETLTVATRKVREENHALESQLQDTTAELGRLREHLEQVRRDAMTDALSGLANRKAFDEALERACDQGEQGGPVTLAVIDIDHFKSFNDTWGHQTGDQVIRYVASVIQRCSPAPRVSARYGGEEFAIIFPGESARDSLAVLEAVREEVSSRILKRRSTNEDLGAITISAGIAERKPGESPASLVERADSALYASKRGGRNRTSCADPIAAAA